MESLKGNKSDEYCQARPAPTEEKGNSMLNRGMLQTPAQTTRKKRKGQRRSPSTSINKRGGRSTVSRRGVPARIAKIRTNQGMGLAAYRSWPKEITESKRKEGTSCATAYEFREGGKRGKYSTGCLFNSALETETMEKKKEVGDRATLSELSRTA